MAELQQDYRHYELHPTELHQSQSKAPSSSHVVALVTLVPVGATLVILAGLTLAGTVIGLAVTTPLFVIFSPVLLPAALLIALAVTGFLTSGAFGITAVSAFAWLVNYVRRSRIPDQFEHLRSRAEETAEHVAQRAKEATQEAGKTVQNSGQAVKSKAQKGGKSNSGQAVNSKTQEEGKSNSGQAVKTKAQEEGKSTT